MSWPSASAELMALLDDGLAPFPCQKRVMFGGPAYFVNGNMFAGVHGEQLLVRLDPDDKAELLEAGQAYAFEPMPGRPMREYVTLAEAVWEDPDALAEWLGRSFGFAASLPAKEPKGRTPRKASRG